MTFTFPLSSFFESSGNQAATFGEELRDGIVTFACGIWSAYPDFITEGTLPAQSFARGFMNQACSPIQPAVPAPTMGFTGGQCVDVLYNVDVQVVLRNTVGACPITTNTTVTVQVLGPISGVEKVVTNPNSTTATCFSASPYPVDQVTYNVVGNSTAQVVTNAPDGRGVPTTPLSTVDILGVSRVDGMPDNCGNPPIGYPPTNPTSQDLTTIINIVNLDGLNNSYEIVYNKISNNYNFPLGFKVNGINVTLDFGGLTFHGPADITQPTSGNDPLPPGSDGGEDGVGGNNDTVYDFQDYLIFPSFSVPDVLDKELEYLICTDGVIETITTIIKTIPSYSPTLDLLVDLIGAILTELCDIMDVEPTVGLPDYYGLKPGVDRPAIVYLYKEFINGTWDASTYSSTVSNPSAAAVAAINTITVPDKTMGTIVKSIALNDGGKIKVSGNTEMEAQTNFNFLINQVDSSFLPTDVAGSTITTTYQSLQIKTVKCRQIEYYPTGKQAGVSPFIRRVIDP